MPADEKNKKINPVGSGWSGEAMRQNLASGLWPTARPNEPLLIILVASNE